MLIDIDYGFFEDRVNIFEDFLLLLCCLQMTVGQIASVFTGDKFLHQEHLQFSFSKMLFTFCRTVMLTTVTFELYRSKAQNNGNRSTTKNVLRTVSAESLRRGTSTLRKVPKGKML